MELQPYVSKPMVICNGMSGGKIERKYKSDGSSRWRVKAHGIALQVSLPVPVIDWLFLGVLGV